MTNFHTFNKESEIGQKCFIIAEIGQNHQGCLETAKLMIKAAKECGVDCVKFQKSNLKKKFSQEALNQPYDSPNSFGKTYGEHKEFLEFSIDQYKELIDYAREIGILFTASAMDEDSYNDLRKLHVPFIKIGSGDNNNWIMLENIAKDTDMPLVISTGMQGIDGVRKLQETFKDRANVGILHCVSSYPTKSQDVNLRYVEEFSTFFSNKVIGYSGHETTPIVITLGAVALGAKIIERHFTLDKKFKGSDHSCSLEPRELTQLVTMIRVLEEKSLNSSKDTESVISLVKNVILKTGNNHLLKDLDQLRIALNPVKLKDKKLLPCEMNCFNKLRKSLLYSRNISKGTVTQKTDFVIKVHTVQAASAENIDCFIGKPLLKDVLFEEAVQFDHLD